MVVFSGVSDDQEGHLRCAAQRRLGHSQECAQRVGHTADTQRGAFELARNQAKREHVEVVIHRPNGVIRNSNSYGNDPNPPKDKKH